MSSLLLVDDNTQLLDFYRLVLEQAGHQVRTAETCLQAVELLNTIDPEIVIMDLRMPEMGDGLGLIRTVRNHMRPEGKSPVKLVVISGWTQDLLDTPEKDAIDCLLPKPVRMEVLLRWISKLGSTLLLCLAGA
jgi:CheY-like chemotaxis protein